MKNILSKRVLSLLLALTMLAGMLPMSALTSTAAEAYGEVLQIDTFKGRVIDSKFALMIPYHWDSYDELPRGTNVESWFTGLPDNLTPIITQYTSGKRIDGSYAQHVHVRLDGIPETTGTYTLSIAMPEIFGFADPVTYQATLTIKELAPCSGCTLKTINEMQVCYKEGKGIHVCETNFGDEWNTVGDKYDKSPEDGYISAEEEPSRMTGTDSYWYLFDIEEVDVDSNGTFQLYRFANLRTVNIESGGVVIFGENNTKLESIITYGANVKGLSEVPASAPLHKIEIKNATVDRYDYNFPMLEKFVLTDSVIDGEADDQIFITKDCAALKHIDLNGTDISHNGSDTNISYDLANLEYLDISNTGVKLINIAYYSKLKYFYAKNNGLDKIIGARGEHDKTLADKCPELREVDISGNNVSQFDIGAHQNIRKLDLSNNKFTAFSAQNLPALKEFRINQQNEASNYTNELAALYVMNCPQLEILDAGYQMNPSFGVALENLPKLKELDLTQCFTLTSIPADVAATVEILKISECTSLNEQFSAAKYPKLKELYAKNVTIESIDGTKGLSVTAPNVEVIEYNGTNAADWVAFRGTNKLYSFVLQGSSKLKSVTVDGAESLEELWLGNNINLEELTLNGTYGLETLDIHVDDPLGTSKITSLDFTDCYSLNKVGVSKGAENIKFLLPSHPGYPDVEVTGWRWVDCEADWHYYPYGIDHWDLNSKDKISDTLKDHEHNHYRSQYGGDCHDATNAVHNGVAGLYAGPWGFPIEEERYRTWNYAQWEGIGEGNSDSGDYLGYKATFNLSPYKETSVYRYGGYAVTAPYGNFVEMPGLVGWATKKFATESEIEYYAGEKIYLTGDIEFWPVYNTETTVTYYERNSGIVWDEEIIEELGLVKEDDYRIVDKCYLKSSLYDYWQYEFLDLNPQREGYIFKGWKYGSTIYQPGDEIEFDDTRPVIYTEWEKQVDNYIISGSIYEPLSVKADTNIKFDVRAQLKSALPEGYSIKADVYTWTQDNPEREKCTSITNFELVTNTTLSNLYKEDFYYTIKEGEKRKFEVVFYTVNERNEKSQDNVSVESSYIYVSDALKVGITYQDINGDWQTFFTPQRNVYIPQGSSIAGKIAPVISGGLPTENGNYAVNSYKNGRLNSWGWSNGTAVTGNFVMEYDASAPVTDCTSYYFQVSDNVTGTISPYLYVWTTPEFNIYEQRQANTLLSYNSNGSQSVSVWVKASGYDLTAEIQQKNASGGWDTLYDAGIASITDGPTTSKYDKTIHKTVTIPNTAATTTYTYRFKITDGYGEVKYSDEISLVYDVSKKTKVAAEFDGDVWLSNYFNANETGTVFPAYTDIRLNLDYELDFDTANKRYQNEIKKYGSIEPVAPTSYQFYDASLWRWSSIYDWSNHYDWFGDYKENGEPYVVDVFYDAGLIEEEGNWYTMNLGSSLPTYVDVLNGLEPGIYELSFTIRGEYTDTTVTPNATTSSGYSKQIWFEILEEGKEHVHDYSFMCKFGDEYQHINTCICGAEQYEDHHYVEHGYEVGEYSNILPINDYWYTTRRFNIETGESYPLNYETAECVECAMYFCRRAFIDSFELNHTNVELAPGTTLELAAKIDLRDSYTDLNGNTYPIDKSIEAYNRKYVEPNTTVFWKSSNTDVATVDENGVVTVVGEGTALITATTEQPDGWPMDGYTGKGLEASCLITVNCQHAKHMLKVPAQEPTCQADGHIEHYVCLDCTKYSLTGDFTDTVSYENDIKLAKVDHAKLYGVWHSDANGHWRECKYGCGTKYDEGTHYSTESANCQHPEYCATCNYVLAPVTDHSHNTYGWSDGYHWSICECGVVVEGSNEVHQFGADGSSDTCDDCGYKKNVGYTVSGTITSYLKNTGDITVQLLSGEEVAYSQVFSTYTEVNASRKEYSTVYSIPAVADGTYTLRISKANHVTRDYTVTVNGGVLTQDAKIHLLGDVTGDGKANAMDKKKIYNHINGELLTGYEFDVANVKVDTKVNAMDKKMIYNHINGESLWE